MSRLSIDGNKAYNYFYKSISILYAAYFCVIYLYSFVRVKELESLRYTLAGNDVLKLFFIILIFYVIVFFIGYKTISAFTNLNNAIIILVIFCITFALRIVLCSYSDVAPVSDFMNYMQMSIWFNDGDFKSIAELSAGYRIPSFSGLGVLNGILGWISTPTIWGMQVMNCVLNSLTAVVIFLIVKLYNEKAAVIASLIFAFYPGNIIACALITYQHGGMLFALLSIYLFMISTQKKSRIMFFPLPIALSLTISYFFRFPILIICIACAGYIAINFFNAETRKGCLRLTLTFLIFTILTFSLINISNLSMKKTGLLYDFDAISSFNTISVGLNYKSNGQWEEKLITHINGLHSDKQIAHAKSVLMDSIKHPKRTLKLFLNKGTIVWVNVDNDFEFYKFGIFADSAKQINPKPTSFIEIPKTDTAFWNSINVVSAFSIIDFLYCVFIIISSFWGIVLINKKQYYNLNLFLWIVGGFILTFMIMEVQGRYKYYSMVMMILFAAIAMDALISKLRNHVSRDKDI